MKIYFVDSGSWACVFIEERVNRILISFAEFNTRKALESYISQFDYPLDIFFDSGAFSAYSRGYRIDLEDYGRFLLENQHFFTVYANLDVIGDWRATWDNQQKLEAMGLSPLPVFHYGEPWEYLEQLVRRYDYLALGGMAGVRSKTKLVPWIAQCFCIIRSIKPHCRVHGFALTSPFLLRLFPWYSVDSSSYAASRYGQIFLWGWVSLCELGFRPLQSIFSAYLGVIAKERLKPANGSPGIED